MKKGIICQAMKPGKKATGCNASVLGSRGWSPTAMLRQGCFQSLIKSIRPDHGRIVKILWAIIAIPKKGAFQELSSEADCVKKFPLNGFLNTPAESLPRITEALPQDTGCFLKPSGDRLTKGFGSGIRLTQDRASPEQNPRPAQVT
jgi:hypothetical protein